MKWKTVHNPHMMQWSVIADFGYEEMHALSEQALMDAIKVGIVERYIKENYSAITSGITVDAISKAVADSIALKLGDGISKAD